MRDSCEMRREAWGILKGKWLWRLLCVVILLQFVSSAVNTALIKTYDALSITTLGDYLMATANAMRQGLSYSLPTAKAYYWMVGGFVFQLFIIYIFAAIFAFGFMGLLLKASRNDDTRWFAGSFGGFARPLEITWLLLLMNLLTALPVGRPISLLLTAAIPDPFGGVMVDVFPTIPVVLLLRITCS